MINAVEGITEQDTKVAGIAHEAGKAVIIAVNKWDLIEKDNHTMNKFLKDIDTEFKYLSYDPRIFINDVLIEAMAMNQPPAEKGKQLRIYYMTQVSVKPPTFVLFVNDTELLHFSYKRYLENQLRDAFGFVGTPIHFIARNRKE